MAIFILYYNLFFPTFSFISQSFGSIFLNGTLIVFGIIYCIFNKVKKQYSLINIINLFYLFMILVVLLINGNLLSFKDIFELQRPLLYTLAFLIGFNYYLRIPLKKEFEKRIENIFNIFIIINFIKMLRIDNIFMLYQRPKLANIGRLSGTFVSPYDYAYFLIFPLIFYIDKYILEKKIKYFIKFIIILFSILLTQSRSQFITMIFSLFLYFTLKSCEKGQKILLFKLIFKISSIVILMILYFWKNIEQNFSYLIVGLNQFLSQGINSNPSSKIRYEQLQLAISEFYKSKFFMGVGPNKASKLIFENQFALYLYRYGILGIIYNLILISFLYFLAYSLLKQKKIKKKTNKPLINGFAVFIFSLPIALLSNNIIDQIRISYFFYFIVGVYTAKLKQIKST